jgi:hypothetical protein
LKRSDPDSDFIKAYQSLTVPKTGAANSGVRLVAGDVFTLLPRETYPKELLRYKIGDGPMTVAGTYHHTADSAGTLYRERGSRR